jgi:hypothetical protein
MPHSHPAGWAPQEIGAFVDSVLRDGDPLPRIISTTRQDRKVWVDFTSPAPVTKAELHYTLDQGNWKERAWKSEPADLAGNRAGATLPAADGITYFLTLRDKRGLVVSTEHEEIGTSE